MYILRETDFLLGFFVFQKMRYFFLRETFWQLFVYYEILSGKWRGVRFQIIHEYISKNVLNL